ncbi:nucleotidyl transferase AbiEii/AbiGii toxin family protein [Aquirufa beregesia]
MIKDKCFTEEWLEHFKKQKDHKRIDKIILEKMIYALHLLERLKANGLEFVFKGGTSLVLLLKEANRFSIDIDIICKTDRKDFEEILNKVIQTSNFKDWKLDKHRSYQPGVPKAHYKLSFDTNQQGSGTILLDVLIEDPIYPEQAEMPIITNWIETETVTMVKVPTIDAITGDKLTAFAPDTIGIPYFKGKDMQPFSMEISKQLFDLSKLFEHITNVEMVAKSFMAFAEQEISYRKNGNPESELTPEKVLQNTIDTCLIIAKKGGGSDDEKQKFAELQRGIKSFDSGFLMSGNFRIDDAVPAAARIAYLSAKILVNDMSSIAYFEGQDIKGLTIEDSDWNFLNKLKKQPDKSSFYYWYQTVPLLTKKTASQIDNENDSNN